MKKMKMITNELLLEKWKNIPINNNSFLRIDAEHLLEWYIGYEDYQMMLLLVTDLEPEILPSSKSIIVSSRKRNDENWALSFKLTRQEQVEVFIRLCVDLIESSRDQTSSLIGLEYVVNRYYQWAKLMEVYNEGVLSESLQKGLIGEIHYLKEVIQQGINLNDAVRGWLGPDQSDQDFVYKNGWYEVKTVGLGSSSVSISSLEQLDAPLPGELIIYFVDKTAHFDIKGFTLNSLIRQVKDVLKESSIANNLFNEKLLSYGYIDLAEYDTQFYRLSKVQKYEINSVFPRLTAKDVPHQIVSAGYQLSIQALEPWKVV